jgi:hypothetical protein
MNSDYEMMQTLFHTLIESAHPPADPGLMLYWKQIPNRLLSIPAQAFFKRLQNIWGEDFVQDLLGSYFAAHPPMHPEWDRVLAEFPTFIRTHKDWQRVFALADVADFSLKVWHCIRGPDPKEPGSMPPDPELTSVGLQTAACFHYPDDPFDMHRLWQESEHKLAGNPSTFWSSLATAGRRGCIFAKCSPSESIELPLPGALVPLLEQLAGRSSLYEALTALNVVESTALQELLPSSISLWLQANLLTTLP